MHTIPRNSPGKKIFREKLYQTINLKVFLLFLITNLYTEEEKWGTTLCIIQELGTIRREVGDYPMYNTRTRDNKKRSRTTLCIILQELGTIRREVEDYPMYIV